MKKTLSLRGPAERVEAPVLQRKGRGWNIAESRLDTLHETAREMRRNPTPAQELLAERFLAADLGRFRLRRQAVIGSAIVDFACQPLKFVLEIDEADADPALESRRDASLEAVGIKIMRLSAADVIADPDGAADHVLARMKQHYEDQRARPRAAPRGDSRRGAPQGGRSYQR